MEEEKKIESEVKGEDVVTEVKEESVSETSPVIEPAKEEVAVEEKKEIVNPDQVQKLENVDGQYGIDNTPSVQNVNSETVIEADLNKEAEVKEEVVSIEEVSVNVDNSEFMDVSDSDIADSSVFAVKPVDPNASVDDIGKDKNEKKGFPFFMVVIFVILIIFALNLENIFKFVEKRNKENNNTEEVEKKVNTKEDDTKKELALEELYNKVKKSSLLKEQETLNNINFVVEMNDKKSEFTVSTTNYLKIKDVKTLEVKFVQKGDIIETTCKDNIKDYCDEVVLIVLNEVALYNTGSDDDFIAHVESNMDKYDLEKDGFSVTYLEKEKSYNYRFFKDKVYKKKVIQEESSIGVNDKTEDNKKDDNINTDTKDEDKKDNTDNKTDTNKKDDTTKTDDTTKKDETKKE